MNMIFFKHEYVYNLLIPFNRPVLALERSLRPALELRLASEVRSGAGLWSFGSVARLHQKLDNDNKRHNLRNYAGFGRQVARRSLHVSSCRGNTGQGRMSKKEVTDKLRKFEWSLKIKANGPVKSFDTNNLAANSPIEVFFNLKFHGVRF